MIVENEPGLYYYDHRVDILNNRELAIPQAYKFYLEKLSTEEEENPREVS